MPIKKLSWLLPAVLMMTCVSDPNQAQMTGKAFQAQIPHIDSLIPQQQFEWINELDSILPASTFPYKPEDLVDRLLELQDRRQYVDLDDPRNWSRLNDPDHDAFVISPGNHLDKGIVKLIRSGTTARRRILICRGFSPIITGKQARAQVQSLQLYADNWLIVGLLVQGDQESKLKLAGDKVYELQGGKGSRILAGSGNTISHCHFAGTLGHGLQISGSFNTIQFSLFKEPILGPGLDHGGVGVRSYAGDDSAHNRILFCEMAGLSDGTGAPNDGLMKGYVPNTIIAWCTIWIPDNLYTYRGEVRYAYAEDGGDFKTGGRSPDETCWIYGCTFRGMSPTGTYEDVLWGGSGAAGAGLVFHQWAAYWVVERCIIYDVALGVSVSGGNPDPKPGKEAHIAHDITIRGNLIYRVNQTGEMITKKDRDGNIITRPNPINGLAFKLNCESCLVEDNLIISAYRDAQVFRRGQATYLGNYFLDVEVHELSDQILEPPLDRLRLTFPYAPLQWPEKKIQLNVRL